MKILIATHGHLASGVKNMLSLFINVDNITCIDAYVDDTDVEAEISNFIESITNDELSFIFTDIYGGSVNQRVLLLNNNHSNIKVITGFNIPLIMEICLSNEKELDDNAIEHIIEESKNQIKLVKLDNKKSEDITDDDFLE